LGRVRPCDPPRQSVRASSWSLLTSWFKLLLRGLEGVRRIQGEAALGERRLRAPLVVLRGQQGFHPVAEMSDVGRRVEVRIFGLVGAGPARTDANRLFRLGHGVLPVRVCAGTAAGRRPTSPPHRGRRSPGCRRLPLRGRVPGGSRRPSDHTTNRRPASGRRSPPWRDCASPKTSGARNWILEQERGRQAPRGGRRGKGGSLASGCSCWWTLGVDRVGTEDTWRRRGGGRLSSDRRAGRKLSGRSRPAHPQI